MMKQFLELFMLTIDAVIYFFVVYATVAYLLITALHTLHITPGTFAIVIIPPVAFLWTVTYSGTWLSFREKRRKQFLIAFLMFNVCPGLLGAATAAMRILYH